MLNRITIMGRMAVIDGRLQLRDWTDRDGKKRRSAEILASNINFGDSKPKGQASPRQRFAVLSGAGKILPINGGNPANPGLHSTGQ